MRGGRKREMVAEGGSTVYVFLCIFEFQTKRVIFENTAGQRLILLVLHTIMGA